MRETDLPVLYDIPLGSIHRSGYQTPISQNEGLRVGVNLGILFGQDIPRASAYNIENSIMGFFVALKFHNHNTLKLQQKDCSPWMVSMSRDDTCVASGLVVNKAIDPCTT